ncbi:MAG: hypothetical protein IJ744_01795 [Lachnospiraceae bacterium]|nr:hypothetical protein [Lachnospiraceae bacterium]
MKTTFEIKDSTPRKNNSKHWQYCVGSGQAKLALRSDYAEQLKFIHDELGIERVRFHGIFDDSMQAYMGLDDFMPLPGAKNFKNYNFHNIAVAYDHILAAGMKPWVELSFMPSRLAKSQKKVTVNADGRCGMPKDDAAWQDFIKAFIRFLIHRYGAEEVESWNFEVWNEPNMSTFFSGSQADYFHLYEITARAVKDIDPKLLVGGPASATGAWIKEFMQFVKENEVPCDFISTHNYPGDGIGEVFLGKIMFDAIVGGVKRLSAKKNGRTLEGCQAVMQDKSEMSEMPKGQMRQIIEQIQEVVGGEYPIYLTEWNCNAILMSPSNDTRKVAAFQVKGIDEMEGYLTGSSIWAFSDIFDEFVMIPDEFSGGFGLLTINGIPKPQFYALKLMSETGPRKYDLPYTNGEVEIAAYEGEDEKRIFVYRQRMKQVAEPAKEYEVKIELPDGAKKVTRYRIDEDHCNPKKVWEQMGAPVEMSREEIAQIKQKSGLVNETVEAEVQDGVLTLSGTIGVNDVHCYVIQRA